MYNSDYRPDSGMTLFHKGHRTRSLFLVTFSFTTIYIFESSYLYFQEQLFLFSRAAIYIFESSYFNFREQLFLFSSTFICVFFEAAIIIHGCGGFGRTESAFDQALL